jgi:hypothetical protein
MAQVIADRRDVDFVLFEQLGVEQLSQHEKYEDCNRKTIDLVINEARNLAVKEILPTQKEGDQQGCKFENGHVSVPECYRRPWKLFLDGEWLALPQDPKYGDGGAGLFQWCQLRVYDVPEPDPWRLIAGRGFWYREN